MHLIKSPSPEIRRQFNEDECLCVESVHQLGLSVSTLKLMGHYTVRRTNKYSDPRNRIL